jgi:hypothetical protein
MNEWTEEANDAQLGVDRLYDRYLCECSSRGGDDPIRLTRREYEAARASPLW